MKIVAIADLGDSDLAFAHATGVDDATFTFPAPEGVRPYVVSVRTDGTSLRFFPERSAGHREVLKRLGIST